MLPFMMTNLSFLCCIIFELLEMASHGLTYHVINRKEEKVGVSRFCNRVNQDFEPQTGASGEEECMFPDRVSL